MAVPGQSSEDVSIDLGTILRALWRAKTWILPLVVLTAVATAATLSAMAPKYKGETRILIESRPLLLRGPEQRAPEQDRAMLDQEGVISQVQLLTSRDLARRVIAAEKLAEKKEFAPADGLLADVLRAVGLARNPGRISPDERVIEAYFERLSAFQVEKSRVIQVEFTAEDPDLAARVANAIVREYLATQGEGKISDSSDTTRWLEGEIAALRTKVAEAENKAESYRSANELFSAPNNTTLVEQQLTELNSQLTAARAAKSDAEARSAQLKRIVDQGGNLDSSTEISNQPVFQRLRERQIALRSRIAELSAIYLASHPQILSLNAQLRDIEGQLRGEARRILAALENDVRVADQRIRELRGQVAEYKSQAARAGQEDVQLRALERDAKAQRDLLESLMARYREASARVSIGAQPADARVISQASPPIKPYFPKVVPMTTVVTLAVLLLAVTLVILRELLTGEAMRTVDGSARPGRPGVVVHDVSIPAVPVAAGATAPLRGLGEAGQLDPISVWSRMVESGTRPSLVVIVSAVDDAVAHDAAVALGRVASTAPAPACLVAFSRDGFPTAEILGAEPVPGLSDLMAGRAGFGATIHNDRRSRLHVIPPGEAPVAPFAKERVFGIIEALRQSYGTVLADLGNLANGDPVLVELTGSADRVVVATAGAVPDAAEKTVAAALDPSGTGRVSILSTARAGGQANRAA